MTHKKVLFLIESLSGGGAEKVLVTLLQHLDRSRFDVTLCCVSNTGKYLDDVPDFVHYRYLLPSAAGLSAWSSFWYRIKYKLVYGLLPLRWVYRLSIPRVNDVEVAFTEGFATKLLAASANRRARKAAWVHIDLKNNPWTQQNRIYRDVYEEGRCYGHYDRIVCVSGTVAQAFKNVYGEPAPVSVLYNPVDSEEIRNLAMKECAVNWLSPKDTIRLVSLGRLVPQKGYDRLIRICGRLRREGYAFELVILGEGDARDQLETMISQEGLADCVRLPGFRTNPYPTVASADLFVCSSRSEGYSTAVTEALILGVPVVTTACSGMLELIGDSGCGLITENDDESLLTGLKSLLDNRALLADMKNKAAMRGQAFSLDSTMKPIEDLLLTC